MRTDEIEERAGLVETANKSPVYFDRTLPENAKYIQNAPVTKPQDEDKQPPKLQGAD